MYNKILVPLDGSAFAECSLDHLRAIALGCHVPEVIVLRAAEKITRERAGALAEDRGNGPPSLTQLNLVETDDTTAAANYVNVMAQKLSQEGIAARGEVVHGRPDETILDYAGKNHVDLIIMSTHGRSGITRWTMGSVADRVVRHSTVPVLLVATPGCRPEFVP